MHAAKKHETETKPAPVRPIRRIRKEPKSLEEYLRRSHKANPQIIPNEHQRLVERYGSEERAMAHIHALIRANWNRLHIRQSMSATYCPITRTAEELLRYQAILVSYGVKSFDAENGSYKLIAIRRTTSPDEFEEKLYIILNLDETQPPTRSFPRRLFRQSSRLFELSTTELRALKQRTLAQGTQFAILPEALSRTLKAEQVKAKAEQKGPKQKTKAEPLPLPPVPIDHLRTIQDKKSLGDGKSIDDLVSASFTTLPHTASRHELQRRLDLFERKCRRPIGRIFALVQARWDQMIKAHEAHMTTLTNKRRHGIPECIACNTPFIGLMEGLQPLHESIDEVMDVGTALIRKYAGMDSTEVMEFITEHPELLCWNSQPLIVLISLIRCYGASVRDLRVNLGNPLARFVLFMDPPVIQERIASIRQLYRGYERPECNLDPARDWRKLFTPLPILQQRFEHIRKSEDIRTKVEWTQPFVDTIFFAPNEAFGQSLRQHLRTRKTAREKD
ncbi:MAG: hypothetical protein KIH65_003790 [Candidatus Uhrbacteria bacterium]|nr:hypothetical protein [Candidatus Uhrbacteria bacterium]